MSRKLCQAAQEAEGLRGNSLSSKEDRRALRAGERWRTIAPQRIICNLARVWNFSHNVAKLYRRGLVERISGIPQLFHTYLGGVLPYH
jgi:hypothetical protein